MNKKIEIKSSSGTYTAYVGSGVLAESLKQFRANLAFDKVYLLIDENADRYHGEAIRSTLDSLSAGVRTLVVPEGEQSKSSDFWLTAMDFLLQNGVRRNTPLIAAGGGVTGDLAGFAAATALRGIPLVHIPTTLLAMVDSSIGGKTGINHSSGKNLIGSFYQPSMVIADTDMLKTLPHNEWVNGLSEILKYGAIKDGWILEESEIFLQKDLNKTDPDRLIRLISRCIEIKAHIVEADEFEGGVRAFLNFGHTFAHALEKASGFSRITHGEAVFLGMLAARKLSQLTGAELPGNPFDKYRDLYRYRVQKEELSLEDLNNYMHSDKKKTDHHLTFVLLDNWQHPVLKTVTDPRLINSAWGTVFEEL